MECNVGGADRAARAAAGAGLLTASALAEAGTGWKALMAGLGAIGVVTAAIRYCPVNELLGVDTCREPRLPG